MIDDLEVWQATVADGELLAAAEEIDPTRAADVERLRRAWPAPKVRVALELVQARRRAAAKFPDSGALVCDLAGVEQASSAIVAAWKARRFRSPDVRAAEDLCCGIGGDAQALARVAPTVAVDRDPVRAWMASENAGCVGLVDDVESRKPAADFAHLDPARRDEGSRRRTHRIASYSPSLERCLEIAAGLRGAAIKVGPGIPVPLPGLPRDAELEFVSEGGSLVQAIVWTGALARAPGKHTASLLASTADDPIERGITRSGATSLPPVGDGFRSLVAVPDPAVERARLLGEIADEAGLVEAAAGLGILTGEAAERSPWFTRFEVVARPRARMREIVAALRDAGAGAARVRTRGRSADADQWSRALRRELGGGAELDLFLLRLGDRLAALVCRPLD